MDFVHGSGNAIGGSEFTLLEGTLNENVVVFVVRDGDVRHVTVENDAVPVGVGLLLAVAAGEPVALFQPGICHFRA
jgi:hypothetical protein